MRGYLNIDFEGSRELAKIHNDRVVANLGAFEEPAAKFGEVLGIELVMWVAI